MTLREWTLLSSDLWVSGSTLNLLILCRICLLRRQWCWMSLRLMVAELSKGRFTRFKFFWWVWYFICCTSEFSVFPRGWPYHAWMTLTILWCSSCCLNDSCYGYSGHCCSTVGLFCWWWFWEIGGCSLFFYDGPSRLSFEGNRWLVVEASSDFYSSVFRINIIKVTPKLRQTNNIVGRAIKIWTVAFRRPERM